MTRMRLRRGREGCPAQGSRVFLLRSILLLATVLPVLLATASARAEDAPRLLLLPVVVHSAEDPEYLRDGLSDMLAARFSRIGSIELIRPDEDSRGTTIHERALALGRKAGADFVLFGSFTRFGQGASLDVQCAPVSEDKQRAPLREIFVHSGSIGEIIPDLDELAGKVSRFARGEDLAPPMADAAAAVGAGAAGGGALLSGPEFEDLVLRIEALEAALGELLEGGEDIIELETGTEEELR